jgi:hypothetical protein
VSDLDLPLPPERNLPEDSRCEVGYASVRHGNAGKCDALHDMDVAYGAREKPSCWRPKVHVDEAKEIGET